MHGANNQRKLKQSPAIQESSYLAWLDSIVKTVRQIRSKVKIPVKKSRRYDGDLLKMETPITSQLNLVYVVTHTLPETVYDRQNMSREKKISAKEQKEYSRSKFGEVPTRELRLQKKKQAIILRRCTREGTPSYSKEMQYQCGNTYISGRRTKRELPKAQTKRELMQMKHSAKEIQAKATSTR